MQGILSKSIGCFGILFCLILTLSSCSTKSDQPTNHQKGPTLQGMLGVCPNDPFLHYTIVPAISNGRYVSGCGLLVVNAQWDCLAYSDSLDFSAIQFTHCMKCVIADALYSRYIINNKQFDLKAFQDVITCIEYVDRMYIPEDIRRQLSINEEMYQVMETVAKANWENFDPILWKKTKDEQLYAYQEVDANHLKCLKVCRVSNKIRRSTNFELADIPDDAILIYLSTEPRSKFE